MYFTNIALNMMNVDIFSMVHMGILLNGISPDKTSCMHSCIDFYFVCHKCMKMHQVLG